MTERAGNRSVPRTVNRPLLLIALGLLTVPTACERPPPLDPWTRPIAEAVAAALESPGGGPASRGPAPSASAAVYLELRSAGSRVHHDWMEAGPDPRRLLATALGSASAALEAAERDRVDAVLLSFVGQPTTVDLATARFPLTNVHRGVLAFELELELAEGVRSTRHAPLDMIARNLSFERATERFAAEVGLGVHSLATHPGFEARTREATEIFAFRSAGAWTATRTFRGNRVVAPGAVDRASVETLAGGWVSGCAVRSSRPAASSTSTGPAGRPRRPPTT